MNTILIMSCNHIRYLYPDEHGIIHRCCMFGCDGKLCMECRCLKQSRSVGEDPECLNKNCERNPYRYEPPRGPNRCVYCWEVISWNDILCSSNCSSLNILINELSDTA